MIFRPALPELPAIWLVTKAQVLNRVPARQGLALGSPTTFGRAEPKTVPPPSEFERSVSISVGVNQLPVEAVVSLLLGWGR